MPRANVAQKRVVIWGAGASSTEEQSLRSLISTQIADDQINYRQGITDEAHSVPDYVTIDLSAQEADEVIAELEYQTIVEGGKLTTIRAHAEAANSEQWDHRLHTQQWWVKGVQYGPIFENVHQTTEPACICRVRLAATLTAINPKVPHDSPEYQRWKEAGKACFKHYTVRTRKTGHK